MKLLYFTDTHIRPDNPKSRKDNFLDTLLEKFMELVSVIKNEKIDLVLHGGDLFERPDIPIPIATQFIKIIQKFEVPFYMITGNHDMFAQNPNTISRTILGMLNSIDIINIIDKDKPIILKDNNNNNIMLCGTSYFYGIDKDPNNYIIKEKPDNIKYLINIVHGMVIDGSFVDGVDFVPLDKILDTKADITLLGHYHVGFKTLIHENKYFINPGAFVRLSSSNFELTRLPKAIIIDLDKEINIKEYTLKSAKSGNEVIDINRIKEISYKQEIFNSFRNLADNSVDFEQLDINNIIIDIAKSENIEDSVKEEALKRIGEIQMLRSENN